jgi:osmotically-inducible protein OsmY
MNHRAACTPVLEPGANETWVQPGGDEFDRDDRDLERQIVNYLAMRNVPEAMSIRAAGGNVRLIGMVPSSSAWHRCLQCCRHVAGVLNVIDRLVVVPEGR